jgi:membrane protein DedA with SNARE-associated domain
MNVGPVIVFGGISAALWNALLMGTGYAVGNNWDVLRDLAERYAVATLILVVIAVIGLIARFVWESRRA